MPYGTIKVDTITFTSGSSDVSIPISGLVQNPTFTGNVTVTGTVSGTVIRGNTVSGATVTGTAGQFAALTGDTAGFTTITGTTVTGTTANFATVSGTTVTGATARFTTTTGVSGVFTSQLSGATITGDTFQGSNITGVSGVFTTRVSGATVTGNAIVGSTITGVSGVFTTVISGASGIIAGNITASAFIPTGSAVPTNGVYLPSANTVGIAANSNGKIFFTDSGVGLNTQTPTLTTTTVSGSPYIHIAGITDSVSVTQIELEGRFAGYGAGVSFSSRTSSGGTLVQMAKITADGEASWNTTQSTQDAGLRFFTTKSGVVGEKARLTAGGNLLVGVTSANANGGVLQLKSGITFPATAVDASDANTLDDYEEGDWTPVWQSGGNLPSLTYSTQTGKYIKIGKIVYFWGRIFMNTWGTGGSGEMRFGGLPFTCNTGDDGHALCHITTAYSTTLNVTWNTGTTQIIGRVVGNTTYITYSTLGNALNLGDSVTLNWPSSAPNMFNNYVTGAYRIA